MAQNSPLSIRCLGCAAQKVGPLAASVFKGLCSQIFNVPAEFHVELQANKNSPDFLFLMLANKKRGGRKWKRTRAQLGVGWDADKVDYEVFPSYLPGTRLSLVIKNALPFFFFLTPQKLGWFR